MTACRACKQLVEENRVLCPHCYVALKNTRAAANRPRAILTLLVIVAAVALALRVVIYRFF